MHETLSALTRDEGSIADNLASIEKGGEPSLRAVQTTPRPCTIQSKRLRHTRDFFFVGQLASPFFAQVAWQSSDPRPWRDGHAGTAAAATFSNATRAVAKLENHACAAHESKQQS